MKFMIVEENVDLLKVSNVEAIGHCANCFCTMGSGIANQIKKVFPEAYTADLKTVSGDINKFGTFSVGVVNSNNTSIKYVYNLYGQYRYGRDSRKLNYEKINSNERLKIEECSFWYLSASQDAMCQAEYDKVCMVSKCSMCKKCSQ